MRDEATPHTRGAIITNNLVSGCSLDSLGDSLPPRQEKWQNLVENIDMKKSSRKAWALVKSLSNDPTKPKLQKFPVTSNQIAHQLLLNGKAKKIKGTKHKIERDPSNENNFLANPFTIDELHEAIIKMKENKAPGLDEIRTEQIKRFGPETCKWILTLINECVQQCHIPKVWRKARVSALLKPGKDPTEAKNFRPVSLLCHLYKVMERMILNRISEFVDDALIPEQAGFRPGKSCCGQVLNLTQYIEDGFEKELITGVAFIDLSAAYDTINHKRLSYKIYQVTKDPHLTKFIQCTLKDRRFFVTCQNEKSRWRTQKNGLAQGSVLAPILYNIYTNDQPTQSTRTKKFAYADDTAVAVQCSTFEEIEEILTESLEELTEYYEINHLKPNPSKTKVTAFHLKNNKARRNLNIRWKEEVLENCSNPTYLGVTLDRTLSYKEHCQQTKLKVKARNNIVRKLTGTSWGANPHVLRTSAMALCMSTAEYAAPVWKNSAHSKQVDVAFNDTIRIVTGCLKPTPVQKIYPIVGIAPPKIRRQVAAEIERSKQSTDHRHPLYNHHPPPARLKSRSSFLRSTLELNGSPPTRRLDLWNEGTPDPLIELKEEASPGFQLRYPVWKSLNRLRTGVTRCRVNLVKWGYVEDEDDQCDCGQVQTNEHLLVCPNLATPCSMQDLLEAKENGIACAEHWKSIV
ncbi:hypothetical protein M8J77_009167 [Diaphorina citri]|nr:hypothetical protein M8J77_009167 [Diaphorina citri]